jgi:uncharacterized protein HemX
MDMGTFKALELLLIVGVVGYFFYQQRQSLQRAREEREAKQADTEAKTLSEGSDSNQTND